MTKIFTETDLIKYHYNELDFNDKKEISAAILTSDKLEEESLAIWQMIKYLDGFFLKPSKGVVRNILDRAREI